MTELHYDLTDEKQVLSLGQELNKLGFSQYVEVDWEDKHSILDMLSDIDWYGTKDDWTKTPDWDCGTISTKTGLGFHPVAGPEDEWDTYMRCHRKDLVLVIATP